MVHLLAQQSIALHNLLQKIADPTNLSAVIECRQVSLTACQAALNTCSGIAEFPPAEQIPVFKVHLPSIFRYYYYFSDLQQYHLTKPEGAGPQIRLHIEAWLSKTEAYRRTHSMLHDYARLDADNMDTAFFHDRRPKH